MPLSKDHLVVQASLQQGRIHDAEEELRNNQDNRTIATAKIRKRRQNRSPLSSFRTGFRKPLKQSGAMKLETRMMPPCNSTNPVF